MRNLLAKSSQNMEMCRNRCTHNLSAAVYTTLNVHQSDFHSWKRFLDDSGDVNILYSSDEQRDELIQALVSYSTGTACLLT